MRLWSIHPKYLDRIGLVALWREGLLAKKVLQGKTKGYKKHPQLVRFLNSKNPVQNIDNFLYQVFLEARRRGYNFDQSKISARQTPDKIAVSRGQILFEFEHLQNKLKVRAPDNYRANMNIKKVDPNPVFDVLGKKFSVEYWERK